MKGADENARFSVAIFSQLPQRGREHVTFTPQSNGQNPTDLEAGAETVSGGSSSNHGRFPNLRGKPPRWELAGRLINRIHPRRWKMWSNPPGVIVFQLGFEALATVGLGIGIATSWPILATDWIRFAALAACATVHIQVTRQQEERRRNRLVAVHIDMTGIWTFPAALLLPIELTILMLLFVRGQRWINSRRPPHRFVFSSMVYAVAALVAQRLFGLLDPSRLSELAEQNAVSSFGILILVGFVYATVQTVAIGGVLALGGTEQRTLRNVLGSKTDNLLEAATVGLGIVTAILLVQIPPAIVILVLVAVLGNRLADVSQLQEEAETDSKTGVFNMRGWTETAGRAFERARRSSQSAALIMLDFDYFKWINDTYGHPAGDDVLRAIARLLKKVTRPTDVVGRFGGEEFVVLLPDTDTSAAEGAADRIRSAITMLRIATTGKHGAPVTISDRTTSIGVAVFPVHGGTLEQLLHAADAAVYEAKERGRDQVRFARPLERKQASADQS